LFFFVLTFLLFELLLSENAVVGMKIMGHETRRGDYSTPEMNPPRPLERSPASRRPVTLAAFGLPAAAAFSGKYYTVNKLAIINLNIKKLT
jgi:hypothetical protein